MRRSRTITLALALGLAAPTLTPRTADAQVRFEGIEGSAGYYGWGGGDFSDLSGGTRFAGAALVRLGDVWVAGVEGYYGEEEVQVRQDVVFLDEYGATVTVRRAFGDPDRAYFFLAARGGWTRLASEIVDRRQGGLTTGLAQNGWLFGPEIGLNFRAGRYVDVLWAAGANWESYGECEVFGPDDVTTGRSCSGLRWGVRVGVALGSGS